MPDTRKPWAAVRALFLGSSKDPAVKSFLKLLEVGVPRPLRPRSCARGPDPTMGVSPLAPQQRCAAREAVRRGAVISGDDPYRIPMKRQGNLDLYTLVREAIVRRSSCARL